MREGGGVRQNIRESPKWVVCRNVIAAKKFFSKAEKWLLDSKDCDLIGIKQGIGTAVCKYKNSGRNILEITSIFR